MINERVRLEGRKVGAVVEENVYMMMIKNIVSKYELVMFIDRCWC